MGIGITLERTFAGHFNPGRLQCPPIPGSDERPLSPAPLLSNAVASVVPCRTKGWAIDCQFHLRRGQVAPGVDGCLTHIHRQRISDARDDPFASFVSTCLNPVSSDAATFPVPSCPSRSLCRSHTVRPGRNHTVRWKRPPK